MNHGELLLDAIRRIDAIILDSVADGSVPVLDAVEMSRLLKALVRGDRQYVVDIDAAKMRLRRTRPSPDNPVAKIRTSVIMVEWCQT